MVKIKGGETGSIKKLKSDLKKRSGGSTWVKSIPKDDELKVRFLTEPDQWFKYDEHYLDEINYFPCIGDDCPGCEHEGGRTSRRYLANALDVEADRVVPLKIPTTLAGRLISRQERYGTMMDRDYILLREGSGMNTLYDADSEPKSRRKLDKYDLLDLEKVLVDQFEDAFGASDDDEDEDDKPRSKSSSSKREKAKRLKVRPQAEDLDDEDDEEEEAPRRTSTKRRTTAASRRRRR